jgi:uncharacterized protein
MRLFLLRLPRLTHWLTSLCGGLLLGLTPVWAQLAVPPLSAHVIDTSGTLALAQRQALDNKLTAFEQSRGTQIVLLLVPSTQPEDITSYANRVANTWKIGRKEIGDGVLLVVAKNERKVRIEVAKTLEGAIPDLAARRVIEQAITPHFKQGDFAGGLDEGAELLMKLVVGEALPAPTAQGHNDTGESPWMDLAIFAFIAVPVLGAVARRILGPKLGALATGGAIGALALLITSSVLIAGLAAVMALLFTLFSNVARHRSGWGTGGGGWSSGTSGSGGGFSSGGGGDFGGGGASGDW